MGCIRREFVSVGFGVELLDVRACVRLILLGDVNKSFFKVVVLFGVFVRDVCKDWWFYIFNSI